MVNVGVIGLGPAWEGRYLPSLLKLRQRIRLCALYDPVASRAEQLAAEYNASVVQGMIPLLQRSDLQAILLVGTSWHGEIPFQLACRSGKSLYLATDVGDDAQTLGRLHTQALDQGRVLMPEFTWRYTPATNRLQELMATALGRACHIRIDATRLSRGRKESGEFCGPGNKLPTCLFDWCRYVVRTAATHLQVEVLGGQDGEEPAAGKMTLRFRRPRSGGEAPMAEIWMPDPRFGTDSGQGTPDGFRSQIICERGWVRIDGPSELVWNDGSQKRTESLTSDRSAVEVMLDHFSRRLVGGLVPVADMSDVCRCLLMERAVQQSLESGHVIELDGQT